MTGAVPFQWSTVNPQHRGQEEAGGTQTTPSFFSHLLTSYQGLLLVQPNQKSGNREPIDLVYKSQLCLAQSEAGQVDVRYKEKA